MNTPLRFAWALTALSLFPASAQALSQSKHRDLSTSACWSQKLPSDFCSAVGIAAYNVDHFEWDELAAHAQPEEGASKCQAANNTVLRIRNLAQQMRTLSDGSSQYNPELAVTLGRALHTIQDNCAHSGMPNPAHAWFSMSDSCQDTKSSPDLQPEAVACAEVETQKAMEVFASAINVPTPPPAPTEPGSQSQDPMWFPPRAGVCDFLKSAPTWNGVDQRWNNQVVVPALRDQLYLNLIVDPASPPGDVCANGAAVLEPLTATAQVDTSQPTEWCTSIKLYCAGKTDGADEAPPWEPSAGTPAAGSGSAESSGCSLSAGDSSSAASLLGLALAALLARSRRRS